MGMRPMARSGLMKRRCYLCQVSAPNETPFNPKDHSVCTICGVKLWELAQEGIEFGLRKQTVLVTTRKSTKSSKTSGEAILRTAIKLLSNVVKATKQNRSVTLTTGYEVDLEDEEGLEHLFNAIIGEVTTRFEDTEEFSERGFGIVYDICICELHFVAGQLYQMGSGINIKMLLDEFGVQWDRVAEKLNNNRMEDESDANDDLSNS